MKTILHQSATRGEADFGWLNSHHTFSFGQYHDPSRIHFGALRVLNDDIVQGGGGFGTHPHDNMEIVSIPLYGSLEHKDSSGGQGIIQQYDVQIMSAGSGIRHSEYNHSKTEAVNFLQIWVIPQKRNIQPRYDQKTFLPETYRNKFKTVAAPDDTDAVWINQQAWFSRGLFDQHTTATYPLHKTGNGVYVFVISGNVTINGTALQTRDGLGITDTLQLAVEANSDTELLLIEIPMQLS